MVNRVSRSFGILAVVLSFLLPAFTVTSATTVAGFPLTASTAFCEPGYLGPFVDCLPWEGVTVSFVATDQDFATACVTVAGGSAASCTVEVPFGSTIVASIEPGAVPVGYVLEGASALEFLIPAGPPEGEFTGPSFVLFQAEEPPVEPPAGGGFPLSANTAYCEPGYLGPFVDCEPWQNVTVSFETTDGAFATSCVTTGTARAAGCVVDVPFGSTVIASIDPGVIPDGYVLEKPASQQIEIPNGPPQGEFSGAVFVLLPEEGGTTAPTAAAPTMAVVPIETGGMPAAVYAATCGGPLPSMPVALLKDASEATGTMVGNPDGIPVATSYTELDVPFATLTNGTNVIVIFSADDADTPVACGDIGGRVAPNGALAIGIMPVGANGYAAVAYVTPLGGGSRSAITVFVILEQ